MNVSDAHSHAQTDIQTRKMRAKTQTCRQRQTDIQTQTCRQKQTDTNTGTYIVIWTLPLAASPHAQTPKWMKKPQKYRKLFQAALWRKMRTRSLQVGKIIVCCIALILSWCIRSGHPSSVVAIDRHKDITDKLSPIWELFKSLEDNAISWAWIFGCISTTAPPPALSVQRFWREVRHA